MAQQRADSPFASGNQWLRLCDDVSWNTACVAYALGLYQGVALMKPNPVCLPEGVDTGQLYEVGVAFMRANPALAHHGPSALFTLSWVQAFPCKK